MATTVSGRTESGDNYLGVSDEDNLSVDFIMNMIEREVGEEELPYVTEVNIKSTVEKNEDLLSDISSDCVERCEVLYEEVG